MREREREREREERSRPSCKTTFRQRPAKTDAGWRHFTHQPSDQIRSDQISRLERYTLFHVAAARRADRLVGRQTDSQTRQTGTSKHRQTHIETDGYCIAVVRNKEGTRTGSDLLAGSRSRELELSRGGPLGIGLHPQGDPPVSHGASIAPTSAPAPAPAPAAPTAVAGVVVCISGAGVRVGDVVHRDGGVVLEAGVGVPGDRTPARSRRVFIRRYYVLL